MICIKCGQEFDEGTKFCTKCGFNMSNITTENKLLKITGILFIVFGAFGIIQLIISLVIAYVAKSVEMASFAPKLFSDVAKSVTGLTIVLIIINAILCFVLGILGILYCKNLDKAKLLQYLVFGYIVFCIVSIIISISTAQGVGGLLGFVVSIFYLIGVQKNLKAKKG